MNKKLQKCLERKCCDSVVTQFASDFSSRYVKEDKKHKENERILHTL